ncbi:MAG TPA: dihydrolipoyl dehydrogenase [Bacillota bacterium]|jgi:dihydrolipoamide dehydrogenase|nr:dihydrolipoyl dehydrogenase [Bacillota bacterium]HQJ37694.1 dihydrolipoyl dehydrogenase [Bacillota bacterium]HQL35602.1 dihydrolipoyl dehydrogenase [Bacillota bacterium]
MKAIVIGGGPGGYVCAISLARHGAEVVLIEKDKIGGTCLNAGCIPAKVLLHTAVLYKMLKEEPGELGLEIEGLKLTWEKLQKRKDLIISQLTYGVENILKSEGVKVINGSGRFTGKNEIEVVNKNGEKEILFFDKAVVATGSRPARIPIPGMDLDGVVSSTEALSFEKIPESLCIVGGGIIGAELANVYSNLGSKVVIVEMLPDIIANMDKDIAACLELQLETDGVRIMKGAMVEKIEKGGRWLKVSIDTVYGKEYLEAEKVLVAVGRSPVTDNLGLDEIGVKLNKNFIAVDKNFRTSNPDIYAIGDVKGGAMLAHIASAEGIYVSEHIMGKHSDIDFRTVPYCVYTKPQLAAVGITEKDASARGYKVKTGIFPFYANSKALITGETNGMAKLVLDSETDEILGLHLAGGQAVEMIGEGALAIRLEATVDEILTTIHAHPTLSEAIQEAAHAAKGQALHLPNT